MGWRSSEMPHDGTPFLAWVVSNPDWPRDGEICVIHADRWGGQQKWKRGGRTLYNWRVAGVEEHLYGDPILWMPLPAAPTKAEEEAASAGETGTAET